LSFFILKRDEIEKILESQIQDILHELSPPLEIEENMPVEIFIDTVKSQGIDAAIVVGHKGKVVGIVTRLDLLKILHFEVPYRLRVLAIPRHPKVEKITIREIMTKNPIMLKETAKVRDAIDLMNKYKISHIIIVDSKGNPKAIFSRRYLLKKIFGIEEH